VTPCVLPIGGNAWQHVKERRRWVRASSGRAIRYQVITSLKEPFRVKWEGALGKIHNPERGSHEGRGGYIQPSFCWKAEGGTWSLCLSLENTKGGLKGGAPDTVRRKANLLWEGGGGWVLFDFLGKSFESNTNAYDRGNLHRSLATQQGNLYSSEEVRESQCRIWWRQRSDRARPAGGTSSAQQREGRQNGLDSQNPARDGIAESEGIKECWGLDIRVWRGGEPKVRGEPFRSQEKTVITSVTASSGVKEWVKT